MTTHRGLLSTRTLRLLILVAAAALAVGVLAGISRTKAVASDTHHGANSPSGPSSATSPIGTTVLRSSPPARR